MQSIIEKDENMNNLFNTNLILDQTKLQKNQITALHRQLEQKDEEINRHQTRIQQYEKRLVLIQKYF